MSGFCKKPCKRCPYRHDVEPFLRPERAEELAYLPQNPYNIFHCHETLEYDEEGESVATNRSKVCAGFLTMQHSENGRTSYDEDGFEPSDDIVYSDHWEMTNAYDEHDERERLKRDALAGQRELERRKSK